MAKKEVYRSADDGRFMSKQDAKRTDPKTWVKETIKTPPPPKKK